jgi:glutamyl-Q tRNA(Asp) synthetase
MAIGTIDTAEALAPNLPYRGRFAPSPTGLMHIGSLATALASYLDARLHNGTWLIRIEDLDSARVVQGAEQRILTTLARMGLHADEPVTRQSAHAGRFLEAFSRLSQHQSVYRCRCTRSETGSAPYSGRCRDAHIENVDSAWRLRMPAGHCTFADRVQGSVTFQATQLGDPVIYRRDGIPAYQLAVVVDDAAEGITDVVRGADLLDNTPWQLHLCTELEYLVPRYAHVPLIAAPGGAKLAKSRSSMAIESMPAGAALMQALRLLQQPVPQALDGAGAAEILAWASHHWDIQRLQGLRSIPLQATGIWG